MNDANSDKPPPVEDLETTTDYPSRPVATGVGAAVGGAAGGVAGGAMAGVAAGGITGPIGAVVGAVVGAVAGALSGRAIGEDVDPEAEDAHWRDSHASRPYADGSTYDQYQPAYGLGVDAYMRYPGRSFEDVEPELGREWERRRGASDLDWDRARHAARDAWQRLSDSAELAVRSSSGRDGK